MSGSVRAKATRPLLCKVHGVTHAAAVATRHELAVGAQGVEDEVSEALYRAEAGLIRGEGAQGFSGFVEGGADGVIGGGHTEAFCARGRCGTSVDREMNQESVRGENTLTDYLKGVYAFACQVFAEQWDLNASRSRFKCEGVTNHDETRKHT